MQGMNRFELGNRRHTPLEDESIEAHSCSIEVRLSVLERVSFLAGLSRDELVTANNRFMEYGFHAGQTIYSSGAPAERLYVVATGKIKLLRHTMAGNDVLLELLGPGEFFGSLTALGNEEYPDTACAQTDCCVLAVAADAFLEILREHPPVALAVLAAVTERLHFAQDTLRQWSAQPAESRIAATLLRLADRLGEEKDGRILIQTPLSRQDLAEMSGVTLETASRVVAQLRKAGTIDSGRQWIAIVDRQALAELAQC